MSNELFELPEGWEWSSVDSLVALMQYGTSAKTSEEIDGIPVFRMGNIINGAIDFSNLKYLPENHNEFPGLLLESGDILFNRTNSAELVGKTAVFRNQGFPCSFASYLIRIRLNKYSPKLFSLYLNSFFGRAWISSVVSQQVGQANVSGAKLKTLQIPVPPLNEQKRIVAKIEELNDRHQRAKQALEAIPELCDRFRQSVLAAAFRGDLTADWREENPDVEPASVLLERIRSDRQQKYVEEIEALKSEGRNLPKLPTFESAATELKFPETWIAISVESACLFIIDCLHSTPKFVEEGEYCIDTTCIEAFKIHWNKARKVSPEDFISRTSRMLPKKDDILFSREGTIGTAVKVPISPKLCLGQRMMMFRFAPSILPEYAELFLQSPIFKKQYKSLILGTTSPHLNIGDIRKLTFLVPPILEQSQIVEQVKAVLNTSLLVDQQYQDADALLGRFNQSILAKAFRGELIEQDPNDEPASVLLDRIRAEQEKLQSNKKSGSARGKRKKATDNQLDLPGVN